MAQALRFECQPGCTECCRQRGFVYLTDTDIPRAAEFLGMTPEAFERRYVYRTRNLRRLRMPREGTCHFLRDYGCSIHPAKLSTGKWPLDAFRKPLHRWREGQYNAPMPPPEGKWSHDRNPVRDR